MKCYQCDEPALLYEKNTSRFFCAKEHHVLYHERWTDLLKSVNAQPLATSLVFSKLGMKRAHEEDEIVVTMRELEFLPDDVIMEVLLYTFPLVGRSLAQTKAAFRAREAAPRIRTIIDQFIIGGVTSIHWTVSDFLTDQSLSLFKGAQSLDIYAHQTKITDKGLREMTNLEKLELHGRVSITHEGLKGMTNLKELTLQGVTHLGDDTLQELSQLTTLRLRHQDRITDVGIGYLSRLESLDIFSCDKIIGNTFGSLSRLGSLLAVYTKLNDDNLMLLGGSLEKLVLGPNKGMTEKGLSKMYRLKFLKISECGIEFTGAAFDAFSESLEILVDVNDETYIKWDTLSRCRNLKKVYIEDFSQLDATETQSVLEKERGIQFIVS